MAVKRVVHKSYITQLILLHRFSIPSFFFFFTNNLIMMQGSLIASPVRLGRYTTR